MSPFQFSSIARPLTRAQRTAAVLAVALTAASASSFAIYRVLARVPSGPALETVRIAVASRPLPAGARLGGDAVKLVAWPAEARPSGALTSLDAIAGRGLIAAVSENEPVTETKLASTGAGAGLPLLIRPGMRAMSVKVDEVIGVAGFVVPGVRVDVLGIMGRGQDSTARVVASDVEILTAGERYDREDVQKDAKPIRSSVVTLLVGAEDAQRIALVQAEGRLMLALRSPLDTQRPALPPTAAAALFDDGREKAPSPVAPARPVSRPAPARAAPDAPVAPRPYIVDAIRATHRTAESVR